MRIKEITLQSRRDFEAIYECGHCGHEVDDRGYDDDNFHVNVIPTFVCPNCHKIGEENYKPRETKYEAHEII